MKKLMPLLLALVLVLGLAACGATEETTTAPEAAGVSFQVVVIDADGTETTFECTSDKATVGEALVEEGLIQGHDTEYGLYVDSVNGITADWDTESAYWSFYIDGEYATTGVDSTELTDGATYSFVKTVMSE